ncbi:hypothetical protein ACFL3Z_02685 [Gemmatimonadota bacterium]
MRFLFSSHAALASLDLSDGLAVQGYEVLSRGYHYGVAGGATQGDESRWIAYRGGSTCGSQDTPEALSLLGTAGGFEVTHRRPLSGMGDVHQLAKWDGGLYLADTAHNRVVFEPSDRPANLEEYVFGDTRHDVNHVNSVFPCGGRVLAVLHNRRHRESQVAVLRHPPGEGIGLETVLSLWDELCHNVVVDGSRLMYLASYSNHLVVADLARDRLLTRIDLSLHVRDLLGGRGHAKGLSVSDDMIVVPVSDEAERDARSESLACLAVFHRSTLEFLGAVDMSDLGEPPGNINEIRRVDSVDLGQGISVPPGIHWPDLRLGRGDVLGHAYRRMRGAVLPPLIRAERALRRKTNGPVGSSAKGGRNT